MYTKKLINCNYIFKCFFSQVSKIWQDKKNEVNVEIKSTGIGLFVWLNVTQIDGNFNENGFIMLYKTKTVTYTSKNDITLKLFNVEIIHLKTN